MDIYLTILLPGIEKKCCNVLRVLATTALNYALVVASST